MKRIIVLACALALVPIASAQMYKYIDKNGKTVYTDQPPPDVDSKNMRIPSSAIGNAAPATKSAVAQDKENQKGKEKVAEGAKKPTASKKRKVVVDEEPEKPGLLQRLLARAKGSAAPKPVPAPAPKSDSEPAAP